MCEPRVDILPVLRRQRQPDSWQHSSVTAVNSSARIHCQALSRSDAVVILSGDDWRRAPPAVGHAIQVVASRHAAVLTAQVMFWCLHAGHRQSRQSVHADWKASKLSTVCKVLQRLVLTCVCLHLLGSHNFSKYQSGYRKGHFTVTALLEVLDGVYTAADNKQVTVLIGLQVSAAFDTVDHEILLQWLQSENYRPMSNLNNISKILKKLLKASFEAHVISSLNNNQH